MTNVHILVHVQRAEKKREELLISLKKLLSNLDEEIPEMKSLEAHGWIKNN